MKKNYTLLVLFILLSFSFSLKSQTFDSIYKDQKIKVVGIENGHYNFINFIENYDDDDKYVGILKYNDLFIAKINDDINITDSFYVFPNRVKYNNKFYSISRRIRNVNDSILIDSNFLVSCNINSHNNSFIRLADTTIETGNFQVIFLKERKFAVASVPYIINYDNNYNLGHFRISIIDTLGNIERIKTYPQIINMDFSLIEYENKLILSKNAQTDSGRTYLINKETLEIEDSIVGYYTYMKILKDSLLIGINGGLDIYINIVNLKTKLVKKIIYPIDTNHNNFVDFNPAFINSIDYTNEDSIYFCYSVRTSDYSPDSYIEIINFNSDGNLNFRYQFDAIQQGYGKQMNGIRATKDGGVIISIVLYSSFDVTSLDAWLIKFNPNGFVGLSNVETGERASLRVYPNPAKDFVLVDIEADRFVEADIEIYDLGGRMVKRSKLSAKVGNRIDVSSLKSGVYGYRVELNGKGVTGKIVIGE